jgi:hypothetical protein
MRARLGSHQACSDAQIDRVPGLPQHSPFQDVVRSGGEIRFLPLQGALIDSRERQHVGRNVSMSLRRPGRLI